MFKKCFAYSFGAALPKFNHQPEPYKGAPYDQIIADRKKYSKDSFLHYYKEPLLIVEGNMQYLYDHTGKRYQDWISGISTVAVGHSHPRVVQALIEQSQKLVHVSQVNLTTMQADYARILCGKLGDGFDSVYFTNSGSEANDFAIHMARLYTKKHKFVSVRNGYHGIVGNASSVTNIQNWNNNAVRGKQFQTLSWPSQYRGILTLDQLIQQAEEVLRANTSEKIAGMILQCIQGFGGINTYPKGYLKRIYQIIKKAGGLMVCDQVQTGFARLGSHFWGHQCFDVKPDIITCAKGIANGLPLGAVITRRQISDSVDHNFFNTTGGGPLQIRAAMQVLKIIEQEGMQNNCEIVGNYLLDELTKIKNESNIIGDVRGKGLMIGIQIVKNKDTKEPSKEIPLQIMEKLRQKNVLIGKGGCHGNVLRLQPPLCMSKDDAAYFLETFENILKQYR